MSTRRAALIASVSAAALLVSGCGDQEPGAFSPRSGDARAVNALFWIMVVVGVAVFLAVLTLFAIAGSRRDRDPEASERRTGRLVIGGGVILPVVVLVPLTIAMLLVANRVSPSREAQLEVNVIGHQFWWEVVYPDGTVTANEIRIPAGRPVKLVLDTADVIHSVWVPQLGGKIDMIPGETTALVVEADEPGTYRGQCAEFCGVQHAQMRFLVIAQPPDEFDAWLAAEASDAAPPTDPAAERGARTFVDVGCASCHTVRGTEADGRLGPDLTHLARRRTLGAATVDNDRGHLAGWIADPHGVKPGVLMPPSPLTGDQLNDLLAYLEGLE